MPAPGRPGGMKFVPPAGSTVDPNIGVALLIFEAVSWDVLKLLPPGGNTEDTNAGVALLDDIEAADNGA